MVKQLDLDIFEFKERIIAEINRTELPVVVKQMAMKDIMQQLDNAASNTIAAAKAAKEAGEKQNG